MSSDPHATIDLLLPGVAASGTYPSAAHVHSLVLSLFDECGPRLERYVRSCGLEPAVAEDVVQDVFLALFRHLQLGRPQHNLRGWLFQVAHNLAQRERRRRRRHGETLEDAWDENSAARVVDPAANPERQLAQADERRQLRAIFLALSERDRHCLALRAEGLRYRDIARVLGISLGSVSKSLARALTRISAFQER